MNNIYKVIWSKVANALVVVSELARSKGVSGRNLTATSSNTVKVRTKLTALSVALSFCFGASSVFAADATYDNVTVNTSLAVNGTATVNGKTIATTDTVNNAVAGKLDTSTFSTFRDGINPRVTNLENNKLDTSTFSTFRDGINPRVTNLENNKLDTSAFNAFKSGDFTTWQTKVNNKLDTSTFSTFRDGINPRVTNLENNKLDTSTFSTFRDGINPRVTNLENNKLNKTDFTTFQSTVNGQITNLTNTKLNTATFNKFNTNLTGLVNQVLGTAFTVAQMQGTLPAYNYTGIKYFRANSTGVDASATGTDAVAIGPVAQATEVDTVAVGHESKALKDAAVAVGRKSYANSNDGIAVGNSAAVTAGGKYAIALGSQAQAGSKSGNDSDGNPLTENTYDGSTTYVVGDGHSAIAIGNKAISRGQNNIAIGKQALTTNKDKANAFSFDSIAIGTNAETIAASSAIALGKGARVGVRGSNAGADSAIAIGEGAQATGLDATAIGHSAQAGKSGLAAGSNANAAGVNSVALGNAAQTTTEGAVAIGDRAYAAPWRTISIGQDAGKGQATDTVGDKNEQINIGVRSGENVDGQLNIGIGQAAGSNVKGKGNIALGQNAGQYIGGTNSSVGNNISIGTNANQYTTQTDIIESVAIGFNSQAGTRAMSLGVKTKATADGSVAIGNSAQANGAGSMAIGKDSVVNGADNVALGRSSIANTKAGTGYLTATASSTVVSVGKSDLLRRVVNVADGADDQDAATVAQLKKVSDDVYNKVNTQINNLHIAATTGINYDVTPRTATENSVTLSKNGKKTIIGSVADGVLDDDAVNVSQLNREIDKKTTHYFSVNQGGTTTLGNFNNNGAVGAKSLAIGMDVRTAGERGVALGNSTSAEAFGSIAIGALYDGSNALDDNDPQAAKQTVTKSSPTQPFKYNMAIGAGAASEGNNAIAIGTLAKTTTKQQNVVSPDRAMALGYYAASSAAKANAIGERATATELKANAFGSQAYAGGVSATAIGSAASASGTNSIAMGSNQRVTAANSGSIGYAGDLTLNTTGRDLAGTYATNATRVSGTGTYSIGNTNSNVTSNESGVFGNDNIVQGEKNIRVMGNSNIVTQNNQNPQGGGAPVSPTLKNVYVTGHANKIDTGAKPLEASKNIFVMGAGNTIGNSQNNATAAQITDSYVIGTGNTVNNPNSTLKGIPATPGNPGNPTFGDDPSDPSTTKSKIGRGYFILGNNVTATQEDSVYLGTNSAYISSTDGRSAGTQYNVPTDPYAALLHAKYTGHWATGVVTVGSVSSPRRIQGVAAGLVGPNSMDAINGSQLYAHTRPVGFVADNTEGLAGKDLDKLVVDEAGITNMVKRSAGQAIKLNGGADKDKLSNNNIGTLVVNKDNKTNQIDIKLAKELKDLTSAKFTDGTNTTTINGKGVSINNNGPSMTTDGINAGNQKITNVANGVADTDAVNVSQLKAARTVVKSDDHSVLVQESENGLTKTYDVSVAMPVVYTKADGTKVYKLADGTFNTDANGGAATKVEAADVIASMHNAAGSTTTAIALANVASSIQNKAGANFAEKLNAANTANPNNAVNVSDLKLTKDSITSSTQGGGFGLKDKAGKEFKQDLGTTAQITGDKNINTKVIDVLDGQGQPTGKKALEVGLNPEVELGKKGTDGVDGKIGVNGKDGSAVVINGKDGSIGLNGKDGANGLTIKSAKGEKGLDGNDGQDGKTRIVYEKPNGDKEEVATLNDGLKFGANTGAVHNAKLNTQVDVKGAVANTDWNKFDAGKNIMTNINGNTITVGLAKELKELTSAEFTDGTNTTTINGKGVSINNNGPSMTTAGINAGGNKITNVKAGDADTDAVNVSQLKAARTVVKSDDHSVLVQESENGLTKTYDVSVAMPVVYTKADGTKVYKLADGTFNTDANGGAATKVEAADVIASMHNAAGSTTTAIALANVASSIQNKAGANFAEKLNAANTANPNNAVNVSDLKLTKDSITSSTQGGGFGLKDKAGKEFKQDLGTTAQITGDKNINTKVIDVLDGQGQPTGKKALEVGLNPEVELGKKGTDGVDGKIGVNGKDGSAVVINGKDGSIGLNGKDGANGLTIKSAKGEKGLDGNDGQDGKTRIVYEKPNGDKEEVATLNDGLKFGANTGAVHNAKLNTQVDVKGAVANTDWNKFDAGKNIMTNINGNTITVGLAKELKELTSAEFTDGTNTTTINGKGVSINNNGPSMTTAGINAGGNKITNVKAGDADTDAVNVSQLKAARTVVKSDDHSVLVQESENGLTKTYDVSVAMPVVYTKADGTKVYKLADGTFNTDANGGAATKVEAADVIASMHNAAGSTTTAIALANVASSIQNKAGANFAEKLNAANTANPNNAVNVSDLKLTKDSITSSTQGGGFGLKDKAGKEFKQDLGTTAQITGDKNINTKVIDVLDGQGQPTGKKALEVGLNPEVELGKKGTDGVDGKIGVNGKDGSAVVINGKDGSIGLNGKDGANGLTIKSAKGEKGLDGNDGQDGKTRIVYEKPNGDKEEVATLNDGLKFGANTGAVHNAKLNTQVDVKGAVANTDWNKFDAGKNIMTNINGNTITVGLAKDLDVNSVTTGDTKVENNGITIKNGSEQSKTVSLTKTGLNNGGNQVVNMDSGLKDSQGNKVTLTEASGDVLNNGVNVGDLKETVNKLIGPSDIGGFGLKDKAGKEFKQSLGTTAQITGDNNINTRVIDVLGADGKPTGKKALEVSLNNDITIGGKDGKDGTLGVKGADGKSGVTLNGKDGSIGIDGKDGSNGSITMAQGKPGVDGKDGETKTRIVYETKDKDGNPVKEEVATLNDGLAFTGNNEVLNKHKLNTTVKVVGDGVSKTDSASFKSATGNINVKANGADTLTVQMSKNLKNLNSVTLENPTDTKKSVTLNVTDKGELNVGGSKPDGNQVTGVRSSITDKAGDTFAKKLDQAAKDNPTNAVNVDDLKQTRDSITNSELGGGFGLKDKAGNEFKQNLGTTAQITGDNNINTRVIDVLGADGKPTGKKALEVSLNNDITIGGKGADGKDGKDGTLGVRGKDGKNGVTLNGKDGTIGIDGKDGSNGSITMAQGKPGLDGKDGETKTRIVYETKDKTGKPVTEEVATLNDGLKFGANSGNVHNAKLNSQVDVKGAATNTDWGKFDGGKNIMTRINGNTITVGLANDINVNSVTTNKVTVGNTTITNDGVTINNGPSITKSGGINANNTTIKNVAPGVKSTDAVNVSQLRQVQGNINRADKHLRAGIAGANAAAGLPQAYLPGKSMVAVSAGTYRGEGAVALGMSRISDNGKVVVKITGNSDTRGNLGASLGAGYQW